MDAHHPKATDLANALTTLSVFLGTTPLTERTVALEKELEGQLGESIASVIQDAEIDDALLSAALLMRSEMGRISDLIHAATIALSLPHVLDPGETISNRPSLAAGNDPSRPFDIETDRRIAEFKLAQWKGSDAMRKRQVFKDLFKLAIDDSGREAELYVLGPRPLRFLRGSKSTAQWALDRNAAAAREFREQHGTLEICIKDYTATHAAHVRLIDLTTVLPDLFGHLSD